MTSEHTITRYRHWYRKLLSGYSQPYRERFAEGMEQTFNDLCRERAAGGRWMFFFVLGAFIETSVAIIRENGRALIMQNKIVRTAIVTGCILLIPLLGNIFVEGWNWSPFDFVIWGGMVFGASLTFQLIASRVNATSYRAAVGIACLTGFLLLWVNGAVGIIGNEDSANAMFLAVIVVGFVGALIAHFEPRGMSRTMFATAVVQALVPLIALTWVPEERFSPGVVKVMCLNAVFVAMWVASALLFRHATDSWPRPRTNKPATGAGEPASAGGD